MPPNQQPYQQFNPQQMPPMMPTAHSGKPHRPLGMLIALGVTILMLLGALIFGFWAFSGKQDFKNNSDKKVADAVAVAVKNEDSKKDNEAAEAAKNPLKTYKGPDTYGAIQIQYPKTWSAYVEQVDKSASPVNGYFHPDFVPGLTSGTAFALRLQVVSTDYTQQLKQFDGKAKTGKVKISAYAPKNVTGVVGSRVEGEITTGQKDVMVLMPLRDKTLIISTESPQFLPDFDNIILANLKFTP